MNVKKNLVAVIAGIAMLAATAACSSTRTQRAPGEMVDDTVVLGSVKAALIGDPVTKARQINVEVNRGVVQLNGFVDSAAEKAQATKVASDVDGVMEVRNNLTVNAAGSSAGEVIDDSILTAKVKAALIESSKTKAHQITVETKQGVVHLSGFVDDASAKAAATDVARSVSGVKDVKNDISVKTS
jgi:hyperosmotically inducible periplasmic protein